MPTDCRGIPSCGPGSGAYQGAPASVAKNQLVQQICNLDVAPPGQSTSWASDWAVPNSGIVCPGVLAGAYLYFTTVGTGQSIKFQNFRVQVDYVDTSCVLRTGFVVGAWSGNAGTMAANTPLFQLATLPASAMYIQTIWIHADGWAYGSTGDVPVMTSAGFPETCQFVFLHLAAGACGPNHGVDVPCVSATPPVLATSTKTGPTTATPGSTVQYEVTVKNTGLGPATNVTVTDTTSPLTNVTVTPPLVASLAVGVNAVFQVHGTIPAAYVGTFTNTAQISCTEIAPTSVSSAPTVVGGSGGTTDLSTSTKVPSTTSLAQGAVISWDITAKNTGTGSAQNVQIVDIVPGGFSDVTWSCPGATPSSGSGGVATTIPVLAPGASQTVTVFAKAASIGTYTNTATVGGVSIGSDAVTVTAPPASAQLSVVKHITSSTLAILAGDQITYEVTISNPDTMAATGIVITDPSTASLPITSWSAIAAGGATAPSPTSGSGSVSTAVSSIPPGGSIILTLVGSAAAPGAQANTVTATHANGTVNTGSVNFTVYPAPTSGSTGTAPKPVLPPKPETVVGTNGGGGCGCGCGQVSCFRFVAPLKGRRMPDGCVKVELERNESCGPWKIDWKPTTESPNPPVVTNGCPDPIGVWVRSKATSSNPLTVTVTPAASGIPAATSVTEGLEYFVLWPGDKLTFTSSTIHNAVTLWH